MGGCVKVSLAWSSLFSWQSWGMPNPEGDVRSKNTSMFWSSGENTTALVGKRRRSAIAALRSWCDSPHRGVMCLNPSPCRWCHFPGVCSFLSYWYCLSLPFLQEQHWQGSQPLLPLLLFCHSLWARGQRLAAAIQKSQPVCEVLGLGSKICHLQEGQVVAPPAQLRSRPQIKDFYFFF